MTEGNQRYDPITGPVVPVFFHYAVPSVLGMLAATSACIIDGMFIGNFVGAEALAAVNIALPVWAAFSAVVFMLAAAGLLLQPNWFGDRGIFLAIPLAEALTFAFALGLFFLLPPRFDDAADDPAAGQSA